MIWRLLLTAFSSSLCLFLAIMLTEEVGHGKIAALRDIWAGNDRMQTVQLRQRVQESLQHQPIALNEEAARNLARAAPLDPLPYIGFLTQAMAGSDPDSSEALAEQTLRRAPRNRAAWLSRLGIAIETDRTEDMIEALSRLYILDPERRPQYMAALAEAGLDPDKREPFLKAIAERPPWGKSATDWMIDFGGADELTRILIDIYPEKRQRYLASLIHQDDWGKAHSTFLSFLPEDQRLVVPTPYNPDFSMPLAPAPFDWSLNASYANAEFRSGLTARFPGQRQVWIARQVMALRPGYYILSTSMRGQISLDGGYFRWDISCVGNGQLTQLNIRELLPIDHTYTKAFEVPAEDCQFQRLLLMGMGGVYPRSSNAIITNVSIKSDPLP